MKHAQNRLKPIARKVPLAALRDLQWRRRRVAITAIGTGLVLAMTLVLSGLSASFHAEAGHFVDQLGADSFVFPSQASGPFYSSLPEPASRAKEVAALPGVDRASPLVFIQAPVKGGRSPPVVLVGVEPGGVGSPKPASGKTITGPGQAVVSTKLKKAPGDEIQISNQTFTVVRTVKATAFAGTPVVFVPISDVDKLAFHGAPLATMFLTRGTPTHLPATLESDTTRQATANLDEPLKNAQKAISFISVLLWIIAGCVLASAMYLSATERSRDFAVFKATGASNLSLLAGLAIQAVIISLASAAVGLAVAALLAPRFPMSVTLTTSALIALPIVTVLVGLLASLIGMRRVASIDPAAAFAGP